jgi:SAM-dependent methyltransferase
MMNVQGMLRKIAWKIRNTPLHPQWLILRERSPLVAFSRRHAYGVTLDIGCGDMWVKPHLKSIVSRYIGLDFPETASHWYHTKPDVFADGHKLPVAAATVDTVLLLNVLEHMPEPVACLREASRVLCKGGTCIIEVPFLYPLHDVPRDFQRWSEYGLRTACKTAGLDISELTSLGTPLESAALLANIALSKLFLRLAKKSNPLVILGVLLPAVILLLNLAGAGLGFFECDRFMPYGYRALAKKI